MPQVAVLVQAGQLVVRQRVGLAGTLLLALVGLLLAAGQGRVEQLAALLAGVAQQEQQRLVEPLAGRRQPQGLQPQAPEQLLAEPLLAALWQVGQLVEVQQAAQLERPPGEPATSWVP